MSKPARPDLKFDALDDLVAEVDRLRNKPYEKTGQWDLPMIVDHVAKQMNTPFTTGIKTVPWPIGPIVRFFFRLLAKRETYPHIKFPAPKFIRPTPGISIESAHAELLQVVEKLKAAKGEMIDC